MGKALIVYASRSGSTQQIADIIAEGLRIAGMEVDIKNAAAVKEAGDLEGYDAYVFGSATYHGEMMNPMKTLLFLAEKANLAGRCAGSFGAFGWSGEAPDRIIKTMEHVLNMKTVGDALRLKNITLDGGRQMAQDYGKQVAAKSAA